MDNLRMGEDAALNYQAAVPGGIRKSVDKSCLMAISEPDTVLSIWQRSLSKDFGDWIAQENHSNLPHLRILVEPKDLRFALNPLLDQSGLMPHEMRDFLINDIDNLVHIFADIANCQSVDVRLERIDNDACWKFHRDTVEVRLLTTYLGPATEWVLPQYSGDAIQEQQAFEGPIEKLDDYDVAIFKGSWLGDDRGIVHRSPPIAGTGHTRLLLCLNKPTVVSPEPWVVD